MIDPPTPLEQAEVLYERSEDDSWSEAIQASATLALAQEAHTANLIALAQVMIASNMVGGVGAVIRVAKERLGVPASAL